MTGLVRTVARALVLAAGVAVLPLGAAAAQDRGCIFVIENVGREGTRVQTATGINYFAGGGVRFRCQNLPITMASDSVAAYGGSVVQFIGNVRYRDSAVTMTANAGTYYRTGDRWESRGNVVARRLETGTTLRGPALDYYRELPGRRDTAEMIATGRPNIDYVTRSENGASAEPYRIVANRVRVRGDDRVWASGRVTIDRSDFAATADSLRLDTGPAGDGTLVGSPVLRGLGADTFTVRGRRIDLQLEGRELSYLTAVDSGQVITREWNLIGDTVGIDVADRQVVQTVAWGAGIRPRGISDRYEIRGDSLAIDTPGQRLRELRAFGTGWIGTAVDSVTGERDWLAGDTVSATFAARDSAAEPDAAEASRLERMRAAGSARAFHAIAGSGGGRPSLNYVRGDVIVLTLRPPREGEEREVLERVDVAGQVEGIQLEPENRAAAPPAVPAPDAGRPVTGGTP